VSPSRPEPQRVDVPSVPIEEPDGTSTRGAGAAWGAGPAPPLPYTYRAGLAYDETRPMVVSTQTRSAGPGQPVPSCHRLAGPLAWISSSMAAGRFFMVHLPFEPRALTARMVSL